MFQVGRKALFQLTTTLLVQHKFNFKLIQKLVELIERCSTNIDLFTNEICTIISDIRQPLTTTTPSPPTVKVMSDYERRELNYKIANMRMDMYKLISDKEQAVEKNDFKLADQLKTAINEQARELKLLQQQLQDDHQTPQPPPPPEKPTDTVVGQQGVVQQRDDLETICRCLDIFISLLQRPSIRVPSVQLVTMNNDFVLPLITVNSVDVHCRVLKCLVLLGVIDATIAKDYVYAIIIPVSTYQCHFFS